MTDPAPPLNAPPPNPRPFPGEDDLCEQCGYPIKGLNPDGDCPECGSAVDASHPKHRIGTDFARSPYPPSYIKTFLQVSLGPKRFFRHLKLEGDANRSRGFLVLCAVLAATIFTILLAGPLTLWHELGRMVIDSEYFSNVVIVLVMGWPVALIAIIVLTYIEVLGVTWFSRKRGWRVPLRHAERVACYASIGWLPGAALLGVVMNLSQSQAIGNLWATLGGNPVYGPDAAWATVFLTGVAAMLGFETLVWVGVRQVKFANTRPADATRPDTPENAPSLPRA